MERTKMAMTETLLLVLAVLVLPPQKEGGEILCDLSPV